MRFGSVCSGIEAASVAWHPLGWEAAWLAEIEPFPAAVLKHHYPDVPNLGDMTTLPDRIRSGEVEAPDLFCGGTPCQAFSVAGLRKSLDDARGNLSLTFCEIANAIDHVRLGRGDQPCIVFWENVPGVLNTKDNAFGCFLAGLAGEGLPLLPPGGRWTDAGCVLGPQRTVAWRTLDAQYFGVAQRRRRVFVVASARDGFDPAAVLLEWEGLRRDSAPSREAGQRVAPCVTNGAPFSSTGNERVEADAMVAQPYPVANTLTARMHKSINSTVDEGQTPALAHSLRGEGFDASEDGTGWGTPLVPVAYRVHGEHSTAMIGSGIARVADPVEIARCLDSSGGYATNQGGNVVAQPVAFHPTQDPISSADVCHSIGANDNATAAVAIRTAQTGSNGWGINTEGTAYTLDSAQQAVAIAPSLTASNDPSRSPQSSEVTQQVGAVYQAAMQVRRLTPVECERLQGFPDGYTAIPWRGKPASECPDGPRYKALGNSWAVPVVRWIGHRIAHEVALSAR